ncbi:hypothetical protein NPX13_g4116 [Xylaria arbuscula]|uniref:Carboxylic ester hydrolase n=1 Tax=Xylaria arbuscula TaxID=114810 RepID=A0A9W8NH03_9PEZI|nr:hypothetical protein NPX13_g4116 [Xylaria arbuscula]
MRLFAYFALIAGATCAPIVTGSGSISGLQSSNNTRKFLGIPYASPPVGELRWRPPQPLQDWEGVRASDTYGPACIQPSTPKDSLYTTADTNFSEDCLYLNIFTGPENSTDRPVLVWFHYGAFVFGSEAHPMLDGTLLASEGITVVTVNFRLGRFGFLALPELSAESDHHASGNYGIMDQIAALEWVQKNIKSFGGDPEKVTIGGASSGGTSIHLLRSSPLAKGLFSKAICESGPGMARPSDGFGTIAIYMTLAAGEKAGTEVLDALGISSLAELRETPSDKILAVTLPRTQGVWESYLRPNSSTSLSVYDTANPIIDGYVVPQPPLEAFTSGDAADIPTLAGAVADDGTALPRLDSLAKYYDYLNGTFGDNADQALSLYPAAVDADVWNASWRLSADQVFRWPTWTSARLQSKNMKSPVWYYDFRRAPPIPANSTLVEKDFAGAFHLVGMLYGFGNLDTWPWDWTEADRSLSRKVMKTWVRFVQSGSPEDEAEGVGSWPPLTASQQLVRIWDDAGDLRLEEFGEHSRETTAFWDAYSEVEL